MCCISCIKVGKYTIQNYSKANILKRLVFGFYNILDHRNLESLKCFLIKKKVNTFQHYFSLYKHHYCNITYNICCKFYFCKMYYSNVNY